MFFADPVGEGPTVAVPSVLTSSVIAVGAAATLVLGVVPGPLLDALGRIAEFIR
jgi:NADH-quinone oxidoreductase subunit N